MEKDLKARVWRMKARKSASASEEADMHKSAAIKKDKKALELKTKATEKFEKAKASVPGEKESKETETPEEEKADEKKSEEAEKETTPAPAEEPEPEKSDFESPYT